MQASWFRSMARALVCGALISICSGFLENRPEASIVESRYYGYPLVWRVTTISQPDDVRFAFWAIDAAFWTALSSLFWLAAAKIEVFKRRAGFKYRRLLLPLVLLVPLGLVMDFVHEFGHVLCGIAAGGQLTYMKVAYFELYPRLALSPEFQLGIVVVTGLSTEPQYGLFQLGGSMTTNLIAWLIGITLLRTRLGYRARVAFGTLGLFGLLDLPLYVLLPQVGLQHWVILGGDTPEPLVGARKMGVPDLTFYVFVALSTAGLAFLYAKPLREEAVTRIRARLGTTGLNMSERGLWTAKVLPALILAALYLDGWFYPLLLLPFLYVLLVEKKSLGWLGLNKRELVPSVSLGGLIALILSITYYPIFLYYLPLIRLRTIDVYSVFTDVLWYPLYEEIAYRGFTLAHFAEPGGSRLSTRNLSANLIQSLLFLSLHRHHLASGMPLVLILVFALGLLNGFLFLTTRNLYGCITAHSGLNAFALLLHHALA